MPAGKKTKDEDNKELIEEMAKETRSFIEKILGDVSKTSASKQLVLGGVSGWCTGYLSMKVGKVAATALGGGIILLQFASYKGYININWDKVYEKVDKVSDKIEERATGEGPKWMDKVERFVDRKLDKAEHALKKGERKAKRWYNVLSNGEDEFHLDKFHIFLVSFAAGLAIGVVTGQ